MTPMRDALIGASSDPLPHPMRAGQPAFRLVYEHADFLLIDKAAGISFHSEQGPGVVVAVEQALALKLYPVHRLDKVTSGLLLLAKSADAAAKLSRMFAQRQIDKYYLALSLAKPKQKQGWVKGDMAPARRGAYKLSSTMQNPALTYFISAGFDSPDNGLPAGARLFLLKPYSGKTHQLRVALKSQSAPIAGDVLYQAQAADRVYLHAYALCFDWDGRIQRFICPPTDGQWFLAPALQHKLTQDWSEPSTLAFPQLKSQQLTSIAEELVQKLAENPHDDAKHNEYFDV